MESTWADPSSWNRVHSCPGADGRHSVISESQVSVAHMQYQAAGKDCDWHGGHWKCNSDYLFYFSLSIRLNADWTMLNRERWKSINMPTSLTSMCVYVYVCVCLSRGELLQLSFLPVECVYVTTAVKPVFTSKSMVKLASNSFCGACIWHYGKSNKEQIS